VTAVKSISIRHWAHTCRNASCRRTFDIDEKDARMAPGVPLVVAQTERPYAVPTREYDLHPAKVRRFDVTCPHCGHEHGQLDLTEKPTEKKKGAALLGRRLAPRVTLQP